MEQENKLDSPSTDEVTITYETLFEILRREKDRSELQKLDSSFFANVLRYLKDKQVIISKQDTELLSEEEKRKTADQLGNVKRIIKDIYDRREKKIVSIAIDKCKNKNSIIDKSVFLNEESVLFDNVVSILDSSRSNILNNLINLKDPVSSGSFNPVVGDKKEAALPKEEDTKPKETKLVRFLNAVPKFVGKELEEYGPFDEEDIASLPVDIANVLINKERVEEISEN